MVTNLTGTREAKTAGTHRTEYQREENCTEDPRDLQKLYLSTDQCMCVQKLSKDRERLPQHPLPERAEGTILGADVHVIMS